MYQPKNDAAKYNLPRYNEKCIMWSTLDYSEKSLHHKIEYISKQKPE